MLIFLHFFSLCVLTFNFEFTFHFSLITLLLLFIETKIDDFDVSVQSYSKFYCDLMSYIDVHVEAANELCFCVLVSIHENVDDWRRSFNWHIKMFYSKALKQINHETEGIQERARFNFVSQISSSVCDHHQEENIQFTLNHIIVVSLIISVVKKPQKKRSRDWRYRIENQIKIY